MGDEACEHCLDKETECVFQPRLFKNWLPSWFPPEQPHLRSFWDSLGNGGIGQARSAARVQPEHTVDHSGLSPGREVFVGLRPDS